MAERLYCVLPNPPSTRVLEVGCGTGIFTKKLLQQNIGALQLNDLSQQMLKVLQSCLELPPNTKFYCGDAGRLEFEPTDLITANAVFQWFENPYSAIQSLSRYLTPAGRMAFSVFGPETLKGFRNLAKIDGPISLFSLEQWIEWLEKAGYEILQSQRDIKEMHWPDTQALLKNLQQIGAAPIRKLSFREIKQLISNYEKSYMTAKGVSSEWEMFYISAVLK